MMGPSFAEIFVILVIALLVLGPERLPGIARSIGRGLREIRKVQQEVRGVWADVENRATDPLGLKKEIEKGKEPEKKEVVDSKGVGDSSGKEDRREAQIEEKSRDSNEKDSPVETVSSLNNKDGG